MEQLLSLMVLPVATIVCGIYWIGKRILDYDPYDSSPGHFYVWPSPPKNLKSSISHLVIKPKSVAYRCCYCHQNNPTFLCQCRAAYHQECWKELGRCASLGCPINQQRIQETIAIVAYAQWEQNGRQPDTGAKNWLEAEKQVFNNLRDF